MIEKLQNINVVAFDADDTLWDNETYFRKAEQDLCQLLEKYADADTVNRELFAIEMENMDDYGYGAVAFILSMIEGAVKVSDGRIPSQDILKVIQFGKNVLHLPATPYPDVVETLSRLKSSGLYRLVLFTKGEVLTQENKISRSGLGHFFDDIVIVSDKTEAEYRNLCQKHGITPENLLMVGNSLKSDIQPPINIGAWGVYIPSECMWQHEVIEAFSHPRMLQIQNFSELADILL